MEKPKIVEVGDSQQMVISFEQKVSTEKALKYVADDTGGICRVSDHKALAHLAPALAKVPELRGKQIIALGSLGKRSQPDRLLSIRIDEKGGFSFQNVWQGGGWPPGTYFLVEVNH